jgi:L-alanine-DL-glutamate epimerase-like enolase superfamily enzyme
MAAAVGITVAGHVFHHLHSQLACVIPNLQWVEAFLPKHGYESIHLIWQRDLEWDNGNIILTDHPGIGVEWDEKAISYYRGLS